MSDPKGDAGQQAEITEPKKLTQQEVDAIVKDRLARERERYADYDDLKQQATQWAAHQEAQKSETQRAVEAADAARKERDTAIANANRRLIQAEFIAIAARAGVAHPEDAVALADRAGVVIDEGGKVAGVEDAVRALVDAGRLPLVGKPQAPGLDGGAGGGDRKSDLPSLTADEIAVAKRMGLTPEQYAKHKKEECEKWQVEVSSSSAWWTAPMRPRSLLI